MVFPPDRLVTSCGQIQNRQPLVRQADESVGLVLPGVCRDGFHMIPSVIRSPGGELGCYSFEIGQTPFL